MSVSPSPALKTVAQPHIHFDGQTCPYCDQPIPEDRLEEISGRIEARARERLTEETAQLREQHARERAQAEGKAKAELEQAKRDASAREALIREEAARSANETAQIKIAAAQKAQAEAEQARAGITGQIEEMRTQNAETIAQMTRDTAAREKAIRAEAAAAAEEALRERLAAAEGAKTEAETARAGMAAQLEAERADKAETVARLNRAAARETTIREEAAKAAEAGAAEKIAAAQKAKAEAEKGRAAAEAALTAKLDQRGREIEALKEAHAGEINAQREALEKDKITALNAERAGFLKVKMKLEEDLTDVQRRLQQKTAHEYGEGAELDLFEVLKAGFQGDRIRRVKKGVAGADIIHEIVEDGKVINKIVYDSKNRGGNFQSEYATKLRKDQIAEKAEFAVLSTNKFPPGERELCTFENVILASPARVLALAEILRGQIVVNHELRVSAVEREKKSVELYAFINSPLAGQLLDSVESAGRQDGSARCRRAERPPKGLGQARDPAAINPEGERGLPFPDPPHRRDRRRRRRRVTP
jgi:hypothetical protein